ncbi:hypothetical protein OUZ56_033470 [Daphnia magna]|uniref:Uncharacterized protein n=1 Tax=Daphnia magna TaxID=35525 RepID=A0ABQ9ZXX7_9CRUS|nr:hypothetical protein OUZ56_033470 [Daphnia magna]
MTEQAIANANTVPFFTIAEAVHQSACVRNEEIVTPLSHAPAGPSDRAEQEFDIANNSTASFFLVAKASQQSNCDGNAEPVTPPADRSPTGSKQETTELIVEDFPDVEVGSRFSYYVLRGKRGKKLNYKDYQKLGPQTRPWHSSLPFFFYEDMEIQLDGTFLAYVTLPLDWWASSPISPRFPSLNAGILGLQQHPTVKAKHSKAVRNVVEISYSVYKTKARQC